MSRPDRADTQDTVPAVTISGGEEVLAYIPHTLGFQPEESVVLIALRPPRGRLGLTIRCDLVDLISPAAPSLLRTLTQHLRSDGAEHVFCAVYTSGTIAEARADPQVRAALAALEAAPGMPGLRDAWLVSGHGYAAFDCTNADCCPPEGRDLRDLESTQVAAEFALRGSSPKARRRDLVPPRSTGSAARRSFAAAYGRSRDEVDRLGDVDGGAGPGSPAAAYVAEVFGSLTSAVPTPSALGRVAALLSAPQVRDAVLLRLAVPDRVGQGEPGPPAGSDVPDLVAQVRELLLPGAPDPEVEQLNRASAVVSAAAALAKPSVRADLCAVLAWLSWWRGDGASAWVAVEEAMTIAPTHRLASLVEELLRRGVGPGWTCAAAAG